MKKSLAVVIGIIVIIIGIIAIIRVISPEDTWICVNNVWVKHGNPDSVAPISGCGSVVTQRLNADAYPLYSGLSWGPEQPKVYEKMLSGYEVVSAPIENITDLSAVSSPFDAYYKTKLEAADWAVDNALAAGGPGASITGYKKGSEYIVISYTTKFKGGGPNEPVRCPCDISFSVFSGTKVAN
ncbi:MAG: hypothetical protein NTU85_02455 [Candidatus Kaiserbacteria bacterium]|nr:hypothetical protein [Candidatus Kaiserbacteria bacterium]